jgi:tetratricopeptide (TPR) repeat protein
MRFPALLVWFLAVVVSPVTLRADILHLTDGTKVEGDVKRAADGWLVTDAKGQVTVVPAAKVKSIELKSGAAKAGSKPPVEVAEQRLYSLRRSVENLSNVGDIVERFQRFVDQNKGTELGKAAEKDLAEWKDRQSRGLVKVGQQWITPEERDALLAETFAVVSDARQLVKDARFKEADAALAKAIQVDPGNPSIQYLRGVLKYRQNEVPAARKAFEAVVEQITNHGPSLNNLAVILSRQNQPAASAAMYDRAMQADPNNRQILDNFAEAFNELSNSERKVAVAQRALKTFMEQDQQVQDQMRAKGLFRWGATWVNQQQLDELKVAEEKIKGRLDQLAAEFDAAQARINTIAQDIEANNRTMRALDSQRYGRSASGQPVAGSVNPRFYDLQADNGRLEQEHKQQLQKMQQLRAAARDIEKQLPTPRFSGTQKLIETEGTPIKLPDGMADPATQPTAEAPAEPSAGPASPAPPAPSPAPSAPSAEPTEPREGETSPSSSSPGKLDDLFRKPPAR